MRFGSWTVYMDIPIPFTNRVLILDLGRYAEVDWRYRIDPIYLNRRYFAA